jgi:hypothetical protein
VSVVAEALAAGFTHVRTYGGPVPLPEWRPYGVAPEDVKYVTFHLGDGFIGEEPVNPRGFNIGGQIVTGHWVLERPPLEASSELPGGAG